MLVMSQPVGQSDETRAREAARLARLGGEIARERLARAQVAWKPDGSMVTDADLEIQARLTIEIARAFPRDGVLGEEYGFEDVWWADAEYWWVLDPIDGTNNFGRGLPGFAVSVGVLCRGVPVAGAVYDPVSDWLFSACAGRGARLNGRRLSVTAEPLSDKSLFAIRSPYADGVPSFVASWLQRYRLRRFGSCALHVCYVALGGLAFVHDHRASIWDLAGAAAILVEAGGVLTRADGSPLFPLPATTPADTPLAFLAGNPVSHAQSLREVEEALVRTPPR